MDHYIFFSLALYNYTTFSNRAAKEENQFLSLIPLIANTFKANVKYIFLYCIINVGILTREWERVISLHFICWNLTECLEFVPHHHVILVVIVFRSDPRQWCWFHNQVFFYQVVVDQFTGLPLFASFSQVYRFESVWRIKSLSIWQYTTIEKQSVCSCGLNKC